MTLKKFKPLRSGPQQTVKRCSIAQLRKQSTLDRIIKAKPGSIRLTKPFEEHRSGNVNIVADALSKAGYHDNLLFLHRSEDDVPRVAKMAARFILYVHEETGQLYKSFNLFELLTQVLDAHFKLIIKFANYLEQDKKMEASSIKNYLTEINALLEWFVYASPVHHSPLESMKLDKVKHLLKKLRGPLNKKSKLARAKQTEKSRVASLRLPSGGFQEVVEMVDKEVHAMNAWCNKVEIERREITKEEYLDFVRVLWTSMYIYSPQGRIGGIAKLKYSAMQDMLKQGTYAR